MSSATAWTRCGRPTRESSVLRSTRLLLAALVQYHGRAASGKGHDEELAAPPLGLGPASPDREGRLPDRAGPLAEVVPDLLVLRRLAALSGDPRVGPLQPAGGLAQLLVDVLVVGQPLRVDGSRLLLP